jgi:hypothetical protein
MSATIELETGGHRDGAGAEAGKVDSIDSATAATKAKAKKLDSARHKMHAKEFVLKVKARFPLTVYKQFLKILHDYEDKLSTLPEVEESISVLLRGHDDLLGEFGQFLPEPPRTDAQNDHAASVQPPASLSTTGTDQTLKDGHMADCARAEKILKAFRSEVGDDAYNEVQLRDILDQFRMGCEKGDCISDCAGPVARHLLRGPPRLKAVWDRVLADDLLGTFRSTLGDVEYEAFLDIMHDIRRNFQYVPGRARHVSSCAERVAQLLGGHPRLVRDFSYFLPDQLKGDYLATVAKLEFKCEDDNTTATNSLPPSLATAPSCVVRAGGCGLATDSARSREEAGGWGGRFGLSLLEARAKGLRDGIGADRPELLPDPASESDDKSGSEGEEMPLLREKHAAEFIMKALARLSTEDFDVMACPPPACARQFLDILEMAFGYPLTRVFKGTRVFRLTEMRAKVAVLFAEHPDLLDEFEQFLPSRARVALGGVEADDEQLRGRPPKFTAASRGQILKRLGWTPGGAAQDEARAWEYYRDRVPGQHVSVLAELHFLGTWK